MFYVHIRNKDRIEKKFRGKLKEPYWCQHAKTRIMFKCMT